MKEDDYYVNGDHKQLQRLWERLHKYCKGRKCDARTVELKTSTGGTKTEQIKTGYSNVNDYSKYLQGKYSYMNSGTTSMQGVPTTVSVSGAFLKKCMNDPEKAKYLEENLAAIPDCAKSAVAGCRGTLTNLSYSVDANGNISVAPVKADSVVKTHQRGQDVPVYAERASQSGSLPQQDSATTFPMPSVIAKYEKYMKAIDEHYASSSPKGRVPPSMCTTGTATRY